MCGRYYLNIGLKDIYERYNIRYKEENKYEFNEIYPSNKSPVVLKDGEKKLKIINWGFKPSYSKSLLINARSETIDKKPTFKDSFYNKRCIIPVSGFFEWEKDGKDKIKRRIHIKDRKIFSLAGIYDNFKDENGDDYTAFTILTTVPNKDMIKIHNRMPVIIPEEKEDIWLDNNIENYGRLKTMFKPYPGRLEIE
ncbi:SOS response-associated peptidase [Clostridium sp. D2Q-11]|uniref:Abasic site processing protein n=1 Tax=Anaeromonas frigoriresistens TaxID=2683708 RepID=A0A942UPT0_9FIRM|nr:SOS response-associated peptidase [Anaeromonas frigoriresistens]MBS4536958.1 SOS response-associated peptidase [Anaeromonas frigoriresistens]